MSVEYRQDRKRWGFRITLHGKRLKRFKWHTKEAAQREYDSICKRAKLPATSLDQAVRAYLAYSASVRSRSRYEGLRLNFVRRIVPYFGQDRELSSITPGECEAFIAEHRGRVRTITIWHYVKDLRALLNWAIKQGLLETNPLDKADLSALRNRKALKLPLDLRAIERGLSCLRGRELLYANVLRYMGLRRSEGNAIQAQDVRDLDDEMWLVVRGTKTAGSERVLAIPPVLWQSVRDATKGCDPTDYILCNNPQRRVYDRRRMFQRVSRAAGIKITAKDLRDYFASVMEDATLASQMLGHTSLRTTAIYTRHVQQRMVAGVAKLGTNFGGQMHRNNPEKAPKPGGSDPQRFRKYLESLTGRSAAW